MEKEFTKVKEWIVQNKKKGVRLLKNLVREDSLRGNESKAQAIIIEKCRELGIEVDIWEIGDESLRNHPHFSSDRNDFSGNPNVVGVLKGQGGGKSLILNSHIDVVPIGHINDWVKHPFSGEVMDGKLYGRGSTDMKGGTVSLLLALEAIIASKIKLKGDIIFQSVIEEESGCAGTLAAVLRGYKGDGAIIPEPTNMKVFPKTQGSLWFRITVKGKQAHGGTRYEGISAIDKGMMVIEKIKGLENERNKRIEDPLYTNVPIPVPINIGKIESGEWPSSVPDVCVIEGRMGVAPNETIDEAKREMESCMKELQERDDWFKEKPPVVEWFGARWLPSDLSIDHPLTNMLTASIKEVTGKNPIIEASPWGTDGGILSNVGNTPVVIFGPGVTEVAHDANEYIVLEDVFEAAMIFAQIILKWCEIVDE